MPLSGFICLTLAFIFSTLSSFCPPAAAQGNSNHPPATGISGDYSGMYSFLRDGEFVQLTVEDQGSVTGFVSRYGDTESDRGVFLDHFFKLGKLEGNHLTFTTDA